MGLLAEVIGGFTRLTRGELALARAEAREGLQHSLRAAIRIAVAAVLGLVALHVLAGAAVAALVALGLGPVWSALAVGLALLLLAVIFLQTGLGLWRRQGILHWPRRRAQALRQDLAAVAEGLGARDFATEGLRHDPSQRPH